jgi:starvation-inducible DNA-binding protein
LTLARQLGIVRPFRSWRKSELPADPTEIHAIPDDLTALVERYGQFANSVRKNIDDVDEAGDKDTADVFTAVSRPRHKEPWFLEAHKG